LKKLFPAGQEKEIFKLLKWHYTFMMVPCRELYMHYYVPGYSKDNPEMKAPQYWVKEYIYALWTRERAFTKKSYLLGWQMTAADVVIYNDLAFFIRLTHNRKDIWIDKFEHL
jgi:hypothetical protein